VGAGTGWGVPRGGCGGMPSPVARGRRWLPGGRGASGCGWDWGGEPRRPVRSPGRARVGGLTVTAMDSAAEPPAAEAFYDVRRGVYYTKPAWRGWLHLLWVEGSLVVGALLLAAGPGGAAVTAHSSLW